MCACVRACLSACVRVCVLVCVYVGGTPSDFQKASITCKRAYVRVCICGENPSDFQIVSKVYCLNTACLIRLALGLVSIHVYCR